MSAQFDKKKDGRWVHVVNPGPTLVGEYDEATLGTVFDMETDQDAIEIEKEMKDAKLVKRVALMKALLFVPEWMMLRVLFSKKIADQKIKVTKTYIKYLFGKISYYEIKKELNTHIKDGKII